MIGEYDFKPIRKTPQTSHLLQLGQRAVDLQGLGKGLGSVIADVVVPQAVREKTN